MSLSFVASILALALLQGALVALPRQDALLRLTSLRSPIWALVLPGMIVVGTFGLVLVPSGAIDLLIVATFATPLLAALAAVAVIRKHLNWAAFLLTAAAGVCASLCHGIVGQVAASLVTACGAMLVGAVIVRLLPGKWLLAGVGVMCLIDVLLMNFGVGRLSSHLLDYAADQFHGPTFDEAHIGMITTEYPDVLLAAVIGAFVAGRPDQRHTALLVFGCVGPYDLLLLCFNTIPATPPLAVALLLSELYRWHRQRKPASLERVPSGGGNRFVPAARLGAGLKPVK